VKFVLEYWPIIGFAFNVVFGWLLYAARKEFASKADLSDLSRRIVVVEASSASLPTALQEISKIRLDLASMVGEMKETNSAIQGLKLEKDAEMRGIERLVERVEQAVTRHEQIFSDVARSSR